MSGKLYSLVFWTTLKYSTVVKSVNIIHSEKNGLMAKLKLKKYPLKIILQNDDQKYLKRCVVNDTGELIRDGNDPEVIKTKPRCVRKIARGKTGKGKSTSTIDAQIVDKPSIFEITSDNDENEASEPSGAGQNELLDFEDQVESPRETVLQVNDDLSKREDSSQKKKFNKRQRLRDNDDDNETQLTIEKELGRSKKSPKLDSSSDESPIEELTVDSSGSSGYEKKLFKEFLKFREMTKEKKKKREKKVLSERSKEVELIHGSGIKVNRFKLDLCTQNNIKNPREMTRSLFKLVYRTEELAKMTVTPTKDRETLPEDVYEAIYEYVSAHTFEGMKLTSKEFGKCVGIMLTTIREGLKNKTGEKKSTGKSTASSSKSLPPEKPVTA